MGTLWSKEPVAIVNAVRLCALAAMTFGAHLDNIQLGASMLALEAVLTLFTRAQVTSPNALQAMTPKTLADAQDAAQPVKDTIRKLPVVLFACALSLASFSGCVHAPPSLSPAGHAAFVNTRVLHGLDLLRDTAIAANAQIPPLISTETTRKVVTYHESALKTIHALGTGWQAVVKTGLDEMLKDLPATERGQLAPYVALVTTLLAEVS